MAKRREGLALGRISSPAVAKATGKDWDAWLDALDAAGAAQWATRRSWVISSAPTQR